MRLKPWLLMHALLAAGLVSGGLMAAPGKASDETVYSQGQVKARYTITVFADLECPFCKHYLPELQNWVHSRADSKLVWQHLPLSMHEPAATREALIAECAGWIGGNEAFWRTTALIFQQTGGDGAGLKGQQLRIADADRVEKCVASDRFLGKITKQIAAANDRGIRETPSVMVTDNISSQSVILTGPADENVLLSAIDSLGAPK
ncbi:thioredoxin domain-containing protein [Pseudomonas ficuserectae]|uniref:DsbA family protein n=1 Tax=Pseudomonas ficuserectae TaxID=53410 RepID=UPI0006D5D602|nr:thioredoxin domain-containing protein [Pseudomonas ficuserectae]KPX35946.1 hypothetical protein ALO69_200004 [Pseudomonas ficuserectae]RMS29246.1 hypothetical protein ALP68_200039 [Pseudomonas ficuserectae]